VDGFADVYGVCAHLDGQSDLANHVGAHLDLNVGVAAVGHRHTDKKYFIRYTL